MKKPVLCRWCKREIDLVKEDLRPNARFHVECRRYRQKEYMKNYMRKYNAKKQGRKYVER